MVKKYVIVGNGIASLSAAKEIRKIDKDGSILIVTSEQYLTYYRVKLSHYISKTFEDEEILVHNKDWYVKNNIEVMLGKIVEKLNIEENQIQLDDGKTVHYDKLLLATGSRPFVPPVSGKYKDGVFALRTLKDLKHIKSYFKHCNNITVIGGGLLGLEAAWAIKELGKKVNVVEFFPYLLPRQLDKELSSILSKKLEENGISLFLGAEAEEILGENKAEGIKFKDGREVKTDAVLFSVGIRPNIDLVRNTNIETNKGIVVNEYLQTNTKNIYAAGDVAEINGQIMGLWTAANEQGKIAGANMAGEKSEYKPQKPYTTLSIGEIALFSVGNIKDYQDVIKYDKDENSYRLYVTDNKLTGGILFGDLSKMSKVRNAVNNNVDISEFISKNVNLIDMLEHFK